MSLRQIWENDERRRKKKRKKENKKREKKKKKRKEKTKQTTTNKQTNKQTKKQKKEIKQTPSEMVTVPGTSNPLSDSHKKKKKKERKKKLERWVEDFSFSTPERTSCHPLPLVLSNACRPWKN